MAIGEKIRLRRQEMGWSLRELSKRMGYANQSTVSRIENGEIDIPQSKVVKFAEVLGVSVAYLMGWEQQNEEFEPAEMVERHIEMIMDADLNEIYDYLKLMDDSKRKIAKGLIRSLAETKTEA